MHEDEPCGCMLNNACMECEVGGDSGIMHSKLYARYSKLNSARLFAELPARQ